MRTYPFLLDSGLACLSGAAQGDSLLLAPLAHGTVLDHLVAQTKCLGSLPSGVLTTFAPGPAYERAVRATGCRIDTILPVEALAERLMGFPPTDRLLLIDPRCLPAAPLALEQILDDDGDPRWVQHLVALESTPAGTKESVQVDASGHVQRIQRYYEEVNWPLASGVVASVVPIASMLVPAPLRFSSLWELRRALSAVGVPSRDVPLSQPTFYLGAERGLLGLNEHMVLCAAAQLAAEGRARPKWSAQARVHDTACVVGPVVLQTGVIVEEGAVVVGPAVLGAHCRIGRDAFVAQSVIVAGLEVPPATIVRQRVVSRIPAADSHQQILEPPPPAHFSATPAVPTFCPTAAAGQRRSARAYLHVKRLVESGLASLTLVALAPLLLIIAASVKLDSLGPVFYGDTREGLGGRGFRCWKFRTMVRDADARQHELADSNKVDGPQFKLDRDPRVTRLGAWLRATNLDELPQLWNVVLGQMSLVGPRPSHFRENQTCVPWREGRLSVRPGITGLWQVCRHDRALGDFHQWIYYDLLYVRHVSPALDLKILGLTALTLGGKRSVPLTWLIPERKLDGPGEDLGA